MRTAYRQREVTFVVEDGHLVRTTCDGATGRSYRQRCPLAAYTTVAHAIEDAHVHLDGATLESIAKQEGLPSTQVNVALEFMKLAQVVEVRHRRCYPAEAHYSFEGALIAYHYLKEHGSE